LFDWNRSPSASVKACARPAMTPTSGFSLQSTSKGRDFDAWMEGRLAANGRGVEMTFAVFDKASGAVAGSTS